MNPPSERVIILDTSDLDNPISDDNDEFEFITLPSPKDMKSSQLFLFFNNNILEIQEFYQHPASWFLNNTIEPCGSLFITSRINPLFIFIPLFEKIRMTSNNKFCELSNVLENENFPALRRLTNTCSSSEIEYICDRKAGFDDTVVYRLNDEKVLNWLTARIVNLIRYFSEEEKSNNNNDKNIGANKNQKNDTDNDDHDRLLRMSLGIISEYINNSLFEILVKKYNLTVDDITVKFSSSIAETENLIGKRHATGPSPVKKKSAKKLKLEDAAKNTKNIMSFFKKK